MSFLLGANLFLGATLLGINISHQKSLLKMVFLFPFGGICIHSLEGFVKFQGMKTSYYPTSPKEFGLLGPADPTGTDRPYGSIFNGIPMARPTPKRWNHPPVGLAAASRRFEPSQGLILGQ